jgi:hypothetical protein
VYIPIKAFQLNWGFIVIGISITGIYPFPWVLISNLSTEYHVPGLDPATIIRKSIETIKKELTGELKEFRQSLLRNYLDRTQREIDTKQFEVDTLVEEKRLHKLEKPRRDRSQPNNSIIYIQQIAKWNEIQAGYTEQIAAQRTEKYGLELKYQIVYNALSGSNIEEAPDPKILAMQQTEQQIDKKFEKLENLVVSIEPLLAPLPISTKPESANFAFTVKNPRPIINFGEDLNDNINRGVLDPIIERFKLKNESFMKSNFGAESSKSLTTSTPYTPALTLSRFTIVQKDPFPKYQNLKLTNVPWISFLYKDWVTKGAQTYGFPGFPPLPIG